MVTKEANFSFTVPDGHAEAGTKYTRAFQWQEPETDAEALTVIASKKNWSVRGLVADALKVAARSNATQNALAPYRPTERTDEDLRNDLVRNFIRLGKTEAEALKAVEDVLGPAK